MEGLLFALVLLSAVTCLRRGYQAQAGVLSLLALAILLVTIDRVRERSGSFADVQSPSTSRSDSAAVGLP